jgi:hypothetical protein
MSAPPPYPVGKGVVEHVVGAACGVVLHMLPVLPADIGVVPIGQISTHVKMFKYLWSLQIKHVEEFTQ